MNQEEKEKIKKLLSKYKNYSDESLLEGVLKLGFTKSDFDEVTLEIMEESFDKLFSDVDWFSIPEEKYKEEEKK